jgi:hypothetical protein
MAINDEAFDREPPDRHVIRCLSVVHIARGEILYRFASSSWHPHFWYASRWWISARTHEQVRRMMAQSPVPQWVARTAFGVKLKWNPKEDETNLMDIVVRATVLQDLKAWVGRGKPQYEVAPNGMRVKWGCRAGTDLDLEQYFIPGISDPHGFTPIGQQALSICHDATSVAGTPPWR